MSFYAVCNVAHFGTQYLCISVSNLKSCPIQIVIILSIGGSIVLFLGLHVHVIPKLLSLFSVTYK